MNLHSCANCSHNALQYAEIGSRLGFCTLHNLVLRRSDHSTCGQQFRKDLLLPSATIAARRQCEIFPPYDVVRIDGQDFNGERQEYLSTDRSLLSDVVGSTVADYDSFPRIATLAQLHRMPGARADLALSSLGRVYVKNCMWADGKWTAGIHVLWWVRERCMREPEPDLRYDSDFRYELPISPDRQLRLAKWSLLSLRLIFISDMGSHAAASKQTADGSSLIREAGLKVQTLADLADDAAESTGSDPLHLLEWLSDVGMKRLDAALPRRDYDAIKKEVAPPQ